MIRFGPSGNEEKFYTDGHKSSFEAPAWLKEMGLNAYEYSFGRGYTMTQETARKIGEEAKKNDVLVSVHAPYYINFANPDDMMAEKSFMYVMTGLRFLKWFGGKHLVVHLATQGKMERGEALELVSKRLDEMLQRLHAQTELDLSGMYICPETMGKYSQIGSYEEIVDFCVKDEMLVPAFDFGHLNCLMQGELKTEADYKKIFDYAIEKLGYERVKHCHIHFSKILFSAKGEIKHLNFDDEVETPNFEALAKVLIEYKLEPHIICESADFMARDALTMKKIYENLRKG